MVDVGSSFVIACDEELWRESLLRSVALTVEKCLLQRCSSAWMGRFVKASDFNHHISYKTHKGLILIIPASRL